jgi:hypothetical protein
MNGCQRLFLIVPSCSVSGLAFDIWAGAAIGAGEALYCACTQTVEFLGWSLKWALSGPKIMCIGIDPLV